MHNRSEMVAVLGTPWAIPPRKSNSMCHEDVAVATASYILIKLLSQMRNEQMWQMVEKSHVLSLKL
jgi:hypothetical protein